MEASSYHFEFNSIIEDIDKNLFLKGVTANRYELQFKSAYLKSCKNEKQFKTLQSKSILRPVVMNQLKNARNFKVNALCEKALYQNAVKNIEKLASKSNIKNEQKSAIFVKWQQDKYFYDCSTKSWKSLEKDQLFDRQYDVLSQKKLFRINLTVKTQQLVSLQNMKVIMQKRKNSCGFLRFKRTICCRVHELFDIDCSTIYQTEDDQEIRIVATWVEKYGEYIQHQITQKIQTQKKKSNTKHELQLKINQKGIEYLKKCDETKMKQQISKAFNLLRDITNQSSLQQNELTKMLAKISLQEKPPKQIQKLQIKIIKETKKVEANKNQEQEELQFIVRRK